MRKEHQTVEKSLANILDGAGLRGFLGAFIAEAEGLDVDYSGRTMFLSGKEPITTVIGKDLLATSVYGKPEATDTDGYLGVLLSWTPIEFSRYLFDLLAFWQGNYKPNRLSSFHGMSYMRGVHKP